MKGTHAHAYVTSFTGGGDLKDAKIKHRTDGAIVETEFYSKCVKWRKAVAEHLKLLETEANDGELAAFASYAIAFPEGFLALVNIKICNSNQNFMRFLRIYTFNMSQRFDPDWIDLSCSLTNV